MGSVCSNIDEKTQKTGHQSWIQFMLIYFITIIITKLNCFFFAFFLQHHFLDIHTRPWSSGVVLLLSSVFVERKSWESKVLDRSSRKLVWWLKQCLNKNLTHINIVLIITPTLYLIGPTPCFLKSFSPHTELNNRKTPLDPGRVCTSKKCCYRTNAKKQEFILVIIIVIK
jgi:hypothetical protein